MTDIDPGYLAEQVRSALATDPRTNELGIEVTPAGGSLHLSGATASAEHRQAILEVAREHALGYTIHDDLSVNPLTEDGEPEDLR